MPPSYAGVIIDQCSNFDGGIADLFDGKGPQTIYNMVPRGTPGAAVITIDY